MSDDQYLPPTNQAEVSLVNIEHGWTQLHPDNIPPECAEVEALLASNQLTAGYKRRADLLINAMNNAYSTYMADN